MIHIYIVGFWSKKCAN